MEKFIEYLSTLWPLLPLLFFIIAVTFRLLDNSTSLFLQRDILINSSNVSRRLLKSQIKHNSDPEFTRKLKQALILRNLQQGFIILSILSFPFSLLFFFLG
ncbi:hypothetical protein [Gramella sp. KN1008]|uniref:hypothetical protein n=1 Tax=Gramella sp. KN1008 TaxID=2529298 RepID=UPI00103A615A|nr:hypothetical protein [Gramella sp. KN1008]TBW27125.1 hypothetical protein EZJ28_12515 [Gramella sp. KN1008]